MPRGKGRGRGGTGRGRGEGGRGGGSPTEDSDDVHIGEQSIATTSSSELGRERSSPIRDNQPPPEDEPSEALVAGVNVPTLYPNGTTFSSICAVRRAVKIMQASFQGPWIKWAQVSDEYKMQWFAAFKRAYKWDSCHDDAIKRIWESKLSARLPDLLYKARVAHQKTGKNPNWISEPHWKAMLEKWETDATFKKLSEQNSKNRNSDCGGLGPSLHTGGSIPISEHKRKHKALTGIDLNSSEVFLKTHTKDGKFVCKKSDKVWGDYTNLLKDKYGETSIARDDNALSGEPSAQLLASQISATDDAELFYKAAGGSKKGRVYGLGSEGVLMAATQRKSFVAPQAAQIQPTVDDIIATPSFKKAVGEMLDERDRQAAD